MADRLTFARFEHRGTASYGVVRGDELVAIDDTPVGSYRETGDRYRMAEVRLLAPSLPTKIICIGLNYRGHIAELGAKVPEKPQFFLKPPSSVIGHEDAIIFPRGAERVDYEGELAVVIKDTMKDTPEKDALNHVLGYSCFNDVTERAIVTRNIADLILAKGFDTFSAFGPYVVTGLDPNNLVVKTYLNGKLMQHDNTSNSVFSVEQILHYLSQCMTLYPGDVVITGTPKGIAPMKPGDVVEVEVEGVRRLRNTLRSD